MGTLDHIIKVALTKFHSFCNISTAEGAVAKGHIHVLLESTTIIPHLLVWLLKSLLTVML